METLKKIINFTKPYYRLQALALLCAIAETGAYLILPFVFRMLIDDALTIKDSKLFVRVIIYYFLVIVTIVVFGFLKELLYKVIDEKAIKDIRVNLYIHLKNCEVSELLDYKIGNIMSYFTNDIPQMVNGLTYNVIQAILYVVRICFGIAVLGSINMRILIIITLLLPFYLFAAKTFSKPIKNSVQKQQEQNATISETLHENISAAIEITVFNRKRWDLNRVSEVFTTYVNLSVQNMFWVKLSGDIGFIIYWLATIVVYFVGGRYVLKGVMTIGTLLLYAHYLDNIYMPSNLLLGIYNNFQKVITLGERYFELVERLCAGQKNHSRGESILQGFKQTIKFKDVWFKYGDETVIKGLKFEINKGEAVAIVGPSGAGKSTIAKLILGLLKPSCGEILIDSINLNNLDSESLYNTIGVVSQEPFLFSDSIYNNLRFGKLETSMKEIQEAVRLASASDFIEAMKEGYYTLLGERGSKLSGGQKQRISIARTILRNSDIIVFDEITSALDSENEYEIFKTINALREQGKTLVVITHSLNNIKNMDKIIILNKGEVEAIGRHDELILNSSTYVDLQSCNTSLIYHR
jgi:ABC-type multidrug transport system fused ATPase/permease subunit